MYGVSGGEKSGGLWYRSQNLLAKHGRLLLAYGRTPIVVRDL